MIAFLPAIIFTAGLLTIKSAQAATSVDISNNEEGSTSRVTIKSNTSSTNGSTSSKSHVRIETNGQVKEFNTTGDEEVNWTSGDGKSSVKINTQSTNSDDSNNTDQKESEDINNSDKEKQEKKTTSQSNPRSESNATSESTFSLSSIINAIFSFFGFGNSS